MRRGSVLAGVLCVLVLTGSTARAADEQQIKVAVERGLTWLKGLQNDKGEWPYQESGMTSLAALTLLECGVPADDPAIQNAAMFIRRAAVSEAKTYSLSLAIMFLDRLGEEVDVALIEVMAARLLGGQYADGGWRYECGAEIAADHSRHLSEMVRKREGDGAGTRRAPAATDRRSPNDLSKEARDAIDAVIRRGPINRNEGFRPDNSNTQFAILALWTARRYGVPVDKALGLVELRFRGSQNADDGGWGYMLPPPGAAKSIMMLGRDSRSTGAMTCAGLLALAMYHVSAGESALRAGPKTGKDGDTKSGKESKPPRDISDDKAVQRGRAALTMILNAPPPKLDAGRPGPGRDFGPPEGFQPPKGVKPPRGAGQPPPQGGKPPEGFQPPGGAGGPGFQGGKALGRPDNHPMIPKISLNNAGRSYYFFWSLERTAVAYGWETIDKKDWYNWGAEIILNNQESDGSWQAAHGRYGADTCFALLFLRRADLAKDLSASLKGKIKDEHVLRGGGVGFKPGQSIKPIRSPFEKDDSTSESDPPKTAAKPPRATPTPTREKPAAPPANVAPEIAKLGDELVKAPPSKWAKALATLRDGKGPEYTQALAYAIPQLEGEARKKAREALAERLSNMKSSTLGTYLQDDDPELRRAAALACAMKEDKTHLGKLIDLLDDPEKTVERAAHAALKDLTKQKFGPAADATDEQRAEAIKAWKAWWMKQAEK